MNPPKCQDCRYWVERPSTPVIGLCHRYPPDSHYDSFPATTPEEWCGEFYLARVESEPGFPKQVFPGEEELFRHKERERLLYGPNP